MKTNKYFFLGVLVLVMATQSYAKGYRKVRWGLAGCGVGAMFIDKNEMLPQIGVWAIAHFLINSQTSGITSGTSNCTDKQFKDEARIEQEVYISSNFQTLSKEAAQGTGEHLDGLAEVFGCDSQRLAKLSQENHDTLFADAEAKKVVDSFVTAIKSDSELSKSCERAI